MGRFFNTAGPVDPEDHYCLPPLARLRSDDVLALIGQKKYFVLHAPRQTGKTSCLLALRDRLNREGKYLCVYANLEGAQGARERVPEAMHSIFDQLVLRARHAGDELAGEVYQALRKRTGDLPSLTSFLSEWCTRLPRPLVLLLDEIDSLVGDTLITVLRNLRAGYDQRPRNFPQSVILCGVRDVRDYRLHVNSGKEAIAGGSAFNIKAESLRIGDFTREDIEALYAQHTEATGQVFTRETLGLAWELTRGQPWLVNALAYETCFRMPEGRDRTRAITADMLQEAKEALILRRETHLDQLSDKLREERVRWVVESMLSGVDMRLDARVDDVDYVVDLGLVRRGEDGLEIANPIYREIIPRDLAALTQMDFEARVRAQWYVASSGRLDLEKLLGAFQEFFREHSEHWVERFEYKEAGPQLLLQAFLQRIVNGGGRIEREYGLGRGRTDLLIIWPHPGGVQKAVVELKVLHKGLESTMAKGLEQTVEYLERCGAEEGHLVIFDRDPTRPWSEKIWRRAESHRQRRITIWGM
jgi:hypothetical protein